ncbi:uncharacterized protein EI90DRAFT_3124384 [Cantharellus anzutake]|uniref:uncharacterized protein n=1 Tax=Cantharellus anzutake TaxID=1750568 RepID=UPI001903F2E5|nr:uncharacterized protein EI90DRAFT_3124384 [Cantharellus anzutake]KAF8330351.1 hypothetical protein EI90DRAFT_3124384 [Cantharellus anzutake]
MHFPLVVSALVLVASARPFGNNYPRAPGFGSCGSPEIEFSWVPSVVHHPSTTFPGYSSGIDGRTQAAFRPINQVDFNHGSAQDIGVISRFICQQLEDKCKASPAQITACQAGQKAARNSTGGGRLMSWIQTSFATSTKSAGPNGVKSPVNIIGTRANLNVNKNCTPSTVTVTVTSTFSAPGFTSTPPANSTGVQANITTSVNNTGGLNFGKCTDPSVIFGAGLDGRKATGFSFLPHNLQQFPHGSAPNPDVIFQFICDNLVNKCGLKKTDKAVTTCRAAEVEARKEKKGRAADIFNAKLGFNTNFAALDTNTTQHRRSY